jgi:hypothetical protein
MSPPSAGSRAPQFATAEVLEVARAATAVLIARSTPSALRYRRWTKVALRCAALIAVGVFSALALLPSERKPPTEPVGGNCCRQEAAAARNAERSPAEVRSLVVACAACHVTGRNAEQM